MLCGARWDVPSAFVALLWSNVVCIGCSGPWIFFRKVRCTQVMLSAMVLSLGSHLVHCDL